MILLRLPFWALWLLTAIFTVTVTLANNTVFNDTPVGSHFLGMDLTAVGPVGYCGEGLDAIEDDDEYEAYLRALPVAVPRPGRWIVFASDATPEQSSISVPWRRAEQLSPLDRSFSPEQSLCGAHPTLFRRPCHVVISAFPLFNLFGIMQTMTYASHSVYATYLYYRWSLDCALLEWSLKRRTNHEAPPTPARATASS